MIKRLIQLVLDAQAAKKLEKEVNRSMRKVARDSESTMEKAFKRIGAIIIAAFSIRAVVRFTKEMFRLGSSAEETASKFRTVFGAERAAELDTFLGKFVELAGLTRAAGRDMLANLGAVFQGAGLAADASAKLSEQMLRLAGDLQSFHDIPIEEAFAAIRSGATGEAEPLKRFGIILREADVQQRALADSGKKTAKELTEQERVVARLALIYEKAGVAVGDLNRTQDSSANRARRLSGRFARMRETVAEGLLPALEGLLPVFEQLASKAEAFANKTGEVVQALLSMAGLVNQTAAIEIDGITRALQGMTEAQKEAFLLSRLQRAGQEYATIRDRVVELQAEIDAARESWVGGWGARGRAKEVEALKEELEAAGLVMNAISEMMGGEGAAPAPPESIGGGGGGGGGADKAAEAARAAQRRRAHADRLALEQEENARFLRGLDTIARTEEAVRQYREGELAKLDMAASQVAGGMTDSFQRFFEATAAGFAGQGNVFAGAVEAARGAGAAIVGALVQGRAETEMALGTAALASGLWPPNPAAIAAASKHFLAAGMLRAIPGIIRGGFGGGGGGGGASVPRGAIGTSMPGTQSPAGPEVHIYIDPLSPGDPRFQRVVMGATQSAKERFGDNVRVNIHPRSAGGS